MFVIEISGWREGKGRDGERLFGGGKVHGVSVVVTEKKIERI
jgi:hypothetical protein